MSRSQPWRWLLSGTILALVATQTPAFAEAPPESGKIERTVQADLSTDGKATFWVRLKDKADLSSARNAKSKADKGRQVYRLKTETADASQARVRKLLKQAGAEFTPYWIVNSIKVTGDSDLAKELAELPEVTSIAPVETVDLPEPKPGVARASVAGGVEWNVAAINAPKVWDELGDRGEGIVIASLDSGVQWDHPALRASYRGTQADGTADHNYNWFDPAGVCPNRTPCDDRGHGTHVMGTMTGADGIGVAPGAKWMTVKACNIGGCPDWVLLDAGEWILAPTDLNGQNPRPDLAPDIVNNSWGGSGINLWYKEMVEAWVAAGIFPAFSNGNEGPECGTTGSPGGYVASYSAGSFDENGVIMPESSRGPGENGEIKPNIAAPGVNVRSAIPGNEYGAKSGTSMASPHVAATVALMWSASPSLRRDIEATRALLDGTAEDVDDTRCGGTAADNLTWGEGKLDAYKAVKATPAGELGNLTGTVTSAGKPVAGAVVSVSGPLSRSVPTAEDGTYSLPRLLAGDYQITVTKFGYDSVSGSATVADNGTATADFTVTEQVLSTVSGTVSSAGAPEKNAVVSVPGTPVTTVTDAAGHYEISLPHFPYEISVKPAFECSEAATTPITVTGTMTQDIELPANADAFGHTCTGGTEAYVEGTEQQALVGDDNSDTITLPFAFPFYGKTYTSAMVSTNGFMSFGGNYSYPNNETLPSKSLTSAAIFPYWDDLSLHDEAGIYTATLGTAPNRTFVVEWRDARYYSAPDTFSFEALLGEDGSIGFRYRGISTTRDSGESTTVGIQAADGADALQYSANLPVLSDGLSIDISARKHGLVTGAVTDANDGKPVAGATVEVGESSFTTATDGTFVGQVPAGKAQVKVSAENYTAYTGEVTVEAGKPAVVAAALKTGRVTVSTDHLTLTVRGRPGSTSDKLVLANTGTADASYQIEIDPALSDWLRAEPVKGKIAKGKKANVKVTASTKGLKPGEERTGVLTIRSTSGRTPVIPVTVTVVHGH